MTHFFEIVASSCFLTKRSHAGRQLFHSAVTDYPAAKSFSDGTRKAQQYTFDGSKLDFIKKRRGS